MKTKSVLVGALALVMSSAALNAQVTIGSGELPQATLDVVTSSTDENIPEGVIAPRLTGDEMQAKDDAYQAAQTGAIVYATKAVTAASAKTANVTAPGYYYFDGTLWQAMVPAGTEPWYVGNTTNQATANNQSIYQNGRVGIVLGEALDSPMIPGSAIHILNNDGDGSADDINIMSYTRAGVLAAPRLIFQSAHGNVDAPENLENNEGIGDITWKTFQNGAMTDNVRIAAFYKGDGTNNKGSLSFVTSNTNANAMTFDEDGELGIGTAAPATKLDINAGNNPGKGFKMVDGTQGAGKVLTSDANGVGTWATMFPNFQTARVMFAAATRTFATGSNSTAQGAAQNVGVGTASLEAGNTISGFTVDNATGIFSVPKGKYFVYFSGDIAAAEYAYEILKRASDNAQILTTIVSERADNFTMLSLDADTHLYLAIGGIVGDTVGTAGANPAPEYYRQNYTNVNSSFQITFMKYGE